MKKERRWLENSNPSPKSLCVHHSSKPGWFKILVLFSSGNDKPSGRLERNYVKWWLEKENTEQKSWQERKETKPSMLNGVKAATARGWHAQGASLLPSVIPQTDFLAGLVPSPLPHSPAFLQVLSLSCPTSPNSPCFLPQTWGCACFGTYTEYHHTKRAA